MFHPTIIELTHGLMLNGKRIIQPNGMPKLIKLLMVLTMLLCNNLPQQSQIITTESTLGLIHNMKKLTLPSGRLRLLKSLKVDTTLLLKDHSLKPQQSQITTTE